MSIEYVTACQAWGAQTDIVTLEAANMDIIGQIPFEFLQQCSATRNVTYLREITRMLLCLSISDSIVFLHDGERIEDDSEATITPGVYKYLVGDNSVPRPRTGPQGKSRSRPFRDTDGSSTVSRSSRSSINQNKFRERLMLRDGHCLISGTEDEENLVAAHIVPFSLGQEFLDQLTTYPRQVTLFSVTNGLLLRPDLHMAYDRFRWGIYVDPAGNHYVHVFGLDYHDFHGIRILYRHRTQSKSPNVHLLNWQYQQCLMARIRGYCVRNATSNSEVALEV